LNSRPYVGVIGYVVLQRFGMRHESGHEVFSRIKQKVAPGDIGRIRSLYCSAQPALDETPLNQEWALKNPIATGMCVSVSVNITASKFIHGSGF